MRDRLYIATMQEIYSNVTKVLVDSKQGSNMLYLPLDKIMQQVAQTPASPGEASATPTTPAAPVASPDSRSRDALRSRERDPR